jgi:hypothetical protein
MISLVIELKLLSFVKPKCILVMVLAPLVPLLMRVKLMKEILLKSIKLP